MPDKFLIRRKLLGQLGRRRYIKFIRSLPRTLTQWQVRYWQEEAWAVFCDANPELEVSLDKLPYLLRYCLMHGCDLELTPGVVAYDDKWDSPIKSRSRNYPEAPPSLVILGRYIRKDWVVPYWACPACTEIMWQLTQPERKRLQGYAR